MKSKNILIVHGFEASSKNHWFLEAKEKFTKEGYEVNIPDFPGGYFPKKDEWVKVIENFNPDESWILIGHSLGGVAILRFLEKTNKKIAKAILIATPFENMKFGAIENFFTGEFDWQKIKENCNQFVVLNEDNDPVVPLEHGKKLSECLNCQQIVKPGYIHFHKIDIDFLEELINE